VIRGDEKKTLFAPFTSRPATDDQRTTTIECSEDYNKPVNTPFPPKLAAQDKRPDDRRQHHHATYAAEATGLLLMAVLLLILTIIRYWRYIPWGAH
jgi:hypothetical protein